jgi:C4-dicarboxylate-specific signal transduction histidine kinase
VASGSASANGLRLRSPQLLALTLALMIGATVGLARYSVWLLAVVQACIAAIGFCALRREHEQAQTLDRLTGSRSEKLLERLSIATQAAGIYCWELDWSTYSIVWDASRLPPDEVAAASRRHFGFELGSDLFKWVHPEDLHAGGKAISESLARGEDHASFRYRLVLPDQSIRHVQAFARTYAGPDGKPQRSVGVSWDVTEEVEAATRAARDALKERELLERLSVATHAAGLQCWEYDFRTAALTWLDNDLTSGRTAGQSAQEVGEAQFALIFPEDLQMVTQRSDAARERREPMMSVIYRRSDPDGTTHYIQHYQRFFYDESGASLRALGANIDITESHRRQVELETLSVRFDIAARAAHAGVWEWRQSTDEIWWNETMFEIYGLSAATFHPTYRNVCGLLHPDDLAHAQAAWGEAVQAATLHVEFRIVRPDGSIAHLDTLATMTESRIGERRLVGITLDISERLAAEQRERRLQKQLVEASHFSGMAEVATGVLHNVGNVLNSLGISASTAQAHVQTAPLERLERVAAMLEEQRAGLLAVTSERWKVMPEYLRALSARMRRDADLVQHEIEAINGHVQYLREIVQAQQSFARVGGTEEAVNIHELIEGALRLKSQELKGSSVIRDTAGVPEVWTDRYKLLQIVVNFVTNACDAMAANASGERRMAVRARLADGQLEIAVEDTGAGISSELMARIWEFGFTTKPHGHGFGLHSSAVAAQQLGGSVSADSAGAGKGARFAVKIPVRVEAVRRASSV